MKLLHSGKVRDVYADGDELLLVASDRISIYDVVLPTPIPDKGVVLTQLSLWWFERLADLVPHHVLSATDVPAEFAGQSSARIKVSIGYGNLPVSTQVFTLPLPASPAATESAGAAFRWQRAAQQEAK